MRLNVYKILFLALILLSALFWQAVRWRQYRESSSVIFLDVGQGDSALLLIEGVVAVIDGGPDNSLLGELGDYLPYFERTIDYLIISHDHDDHTLGLFELLRRYKVVNLVYGPTIAGRSAAEDLRRRAAIGGVKEFPVAGSAVIYLRGGYVLDLLNPVVLGVKKDDNNSLLVRLSGPEKKVLFMGDNSFRVEEAIASSRWDIDVDILKAGHHGSKTSSSSSFLAQVSPDYFIVSSGSHNSFGHPHQEVLDRARAVGAVIKRTDVEGSLEFVFSGP